MCLKNLVRLFERFLLFNQDQIFYEFLKKIVWKKREKSSKIVFEELFYLV
jgi:hypothetical protein